MMGDDIAFAVLGVPCRFKTRISEAAGHFRHVYKYLIREASHFPGEMAIELVRKGTWYVVRCDGEEYARYQDLLQAVLELEFMAFQVPMKRMAGIALFHAAWLLKGHRAMILFGRGESGKSSLAYELSARGYAFGSDEWTGVDETGAFVPFPRKILLKSGNPLIKQYSLKSSCRNILRKLDGRIYADIPGSGKVAVKGVYDPVLFFLKKKPEKPTALKEVSELKAIGEMVAACPNRKKMSERLFQTLVAFPKNGKAFCLESKSVDDARKIIFEVAGV